ncbi:smoothelin isoform X2 [Myiozetetes cayanensis]|uniref:smoothelin isoform X2 n=2 Tax=Myiozetetes cayanensis TaxID=478635 RepID=UPI0021600915|nr:smoothelin isoform X2 [Myiozetetes cayanensis]
MSQESLLGMDEGALRKLLEATLDLAERRRIRSAIRELQRQELERDEEALASKRFRPEHGSHRQDDKENWPQSQHLEEEQQAALAALSQQLETITSVEELTKLLRAAGEYEERKVIRAAIRKLRAEEIEAATLAGNVQSSRRAGNEPRTVPGDAKIIQRDNAETPALTESGESLGKGSAKPLGTARRRGSSHQDDAELPALAELEESGHRGAAEQPPAQEPEVLADHEREDLVEQEHVPGRMLELCSRQAGDPQKPSAQEVVSGTLVLLELQPAPEPDPEPEDGVGELGQGQPQGQQQAAWKAGSLDRPARAAEPSRRQSPRGEQPHLGQPGAASQLHVGVRCQALGPDGRHGRPPVAPVSTQELVGTPAHLNTHQQEQVPSSLCPTGRTAPRSAEPPPPSAAGSVRERAQRFGPAGAGGAGAGRGRSRSRGRPMAAGAPHGPAGARSKRAGQRRRRAAPDSAPRRPPPRRHEDLLHHRDQGWACAAPRAPHHGHPRQPAGRGDPGAAEHPNPHHHHPQQRQQYLQHQQCQQQCHQAQDPCAHFEGTEEPSGPVAHPPTFSSTCQQSALHLSRTNSSMEPEVVEQPQVLRLEPELPNGTEKVQVREVERRSKLNVEELSKIEDEDVLDKMLDQTTDFEERRLIRNAMRELRQRKRDQREKERDQRLQEARSQAMAGRAGHTTETTTTQSTQSADGSARSTVTKTERLIQSSDGTKTSRTTTMESSYVKRSDNGKSTFVQTKSSYSSSSKKTGSIFDREDESASRQSSLAALERRQAEKKKELMKAQSLPKTSTSQARKAMMEKLQKEGGSSPNPAASQTTVQRSSSFGVPNANSIKQMLLDWCRAKTRGYEHVDIQNFSSSWSDGMAFCALVHNFFPDAFDYSKLTPQNRRHNFEVAFSSAEKHADCPQLLDVEDMVRMREPDWKCVYTYIQEFYRCLVQKGLVKTKKS